MRLGEWAWLRTSDSSETALYLGLWLIGLPVALLVLFLILRPVDDRQATQIQTVARWIEPLPGIRFDAAGFAALTPRRPDFGHARWTQAALPDVVVLPPVTQTPKEAPSPDSGCG